MNEVTVQQHESKRIFEREYIVNANRCATAQLLSID